MSTASDRAALRDHLDKTVLGGNHPTAVVVPRSTVEALLEEPDRRLKENALRLADDHRARCDSSECTTSLVMLAELIQAAGFELDDGDVRRLT